MLRSVTAASRIMLPTYPVLAFLIGLNFAVGPRERILTSSALADADGFISIRLWGIGLLVLAAILAAALVFRDHRSLYLTGLGSLLVWMTALAVVFLASAVFSNGSLTAWVWPAFAARCCWASLVSVEAGER